jgi:large subunit ribosomal protein L24e
MVVKTELCAISEYRIYPGHGIRFIRRDGQPVILGSSKAKSMMQQRKKPAKLMWTQAWRRLNKKGKDEGIVKKK